MDLNYLLYRQQVERSLAQNAACPEARDAHAELAALYEARIERATKGNLTFIRAQRSRCSAAARSSAALTLKNGSAGSADHSTTTYPTASAKPLSDRLPVLR
jgi:hypothetical protein